MGTIDSYLALLKPRGTLACVGLPEKDQKSQLWFQSMVPTERNLVGSYLGPYDDYQEMLDFAREHNIKPKVEIMPAHEVNEAIMKVRNNSARYRVCSSSPSGTRMSGSARRCCADMCILLCTDWIAMGATRDRGP